VHVRKLTLRWRQKRQALTARRLPCLVIVRQSSYASRNKKSTRYFPRGEYGRKITKRTTTASEIPRKRWAAERNPPLNMSSGPRVFYRLIKKDSLVGCLERVIYRQIPYVYRTTSLFVVLSAKGLSRGMRTPSCSIRSISVNEHCQ
jgi:hypothetical protein